MKGINEDTSSAETYMTMVNLPSQKLKSWQKLRLEGTIRKWPKAQRVETPQIKTGLVVAAAMSLSVSQAESFFVQDANTAMKMNSAVAGDSTTMRKKFMAKQWAALVGFSGAETQKQVQNIWKQIGKAHDETEVRTIVVTAIKEQQVDVDRQSIRVWFGDNVAEDIWKCRFTYRPMANMAKTERSISIMVSIRWTAQEIWDMEEAELEKQRINHITPEILKRFQKKQRLPPM